MLQEFKDFIAKGNVMDLAVGIIIGAAFTAIVNSLVSDMINPVIGLVLGGVDFTNMYVVLSGTVPADAGLDAAQESDAAIFAYGAVFMLVKAVNRLKSIAEAPDEIAPEVKTGPSQLDVLLQIRDSLAKK